MPEKQPAVPLAVRLAALGSEPRLRILAELSAGPLHVSELARRVWMSRQLLYLHLAKLEQAGFVSGVADVADDGKALKLFELNEFELNEFELNVDIARIVGEYPQTP
ncbi:ArsR/SmtB family transcription factor [Paeniglutamicibacter kerguelensis]|uniref:Transcriptional regulator n=1 Tax=Paeniglutamicibacter kerguelensis TaxID=254788 RepID=A0ABS4XJE2_9MICC|nr:helix-turn-helix domain-containing protein [Paeniglutamicibacter kerguelensis]MBP2388451.1 putative transcriptional regulator [Paeniglutamicibacter kerguelensis]